MRRSTERKERKEEGENREEGRRKRRDRECIRQLMNKRNTMGIRQRGAGGKEQ